MLLRSKFISKYQLQLVPQQCRLYSRKTITSSLVSSEGAVDLAYTAHIPPDGNSTKGALVILHGLFGSKRNWISLSKAFQRAMPTRPVYTLDLRNHGHSPFKAPMTYEAMAGDVGVFIEKHNLSDVALLGHSMGGKVAMTLALSHAVSEVLSNLIVADISPINTRLHDEFIRYLSAMQHLNDMPAGKIKTRADADHQIQAFESDLSIRQFLLTNLELPSHSRAVTASNPPSKAHFKLPISLLRASVPALGAFPYDWTAGADERPQWDGRTLVIKGAKSSYIKEEDIPALQAFFPNIELEILDAGHWVHAEQPNQFKALVVDFLKENE